jgi:Peptidase family M1 domain
MKKHFFLLTIAGVVTTVLMAQPNRWQQRVKYSMDIDMDVAANRFSGKQKLQYSNNSPDTLYRVFYHLYWNAFQPNSMMDTRSRHLGTIKINGRPDWDGRVRDRILKLKENEIGYQKVKWVKISGIAQTLVQHETILEVKLAKPILPKTTVTLDMEFEAQVPLQVRRSGRDNPQTGVRYSMSQWYPKLCEYDYEGWHPTPYVAREFYGVWGDYEVKINIDQKYLVGGTGYLQNSASIGMGYQTAGTKTGAPVGEKKTWHFIAPDVHDFMWAADPEYQHLTRTTADGVTIHVLYNKEEAVLRKQFDALPASQKSKYDNDFNKFAEYWDGQWKEVADAAVVVLPFIEAMFGKYPYKQYSFIHGGDGGMEYPMGTLLAGPGLGTAFHEWMHTWYQMLLGTNESLYAWMDEGFTSYAETLVSAYYESVKNNKELRLENVPVDKRAAQINDLLQAIRRQDPHQGAYQGYKALAKSGLEEPLTTHADHYEANFAYGIASYSKGEIFIEQLGYIVGAATRDDILREYYRQWVFKHPNLNDFMQIAEKESNMKLDWYREYFVNTTKTIDYALDSLWEEGGVTKIRLLNKGKIPMPIDVQVTLKDGTSEMHYVPMYLMFGSKPPEDPLIKRKEYLPWKWTHDTYIIETKTKPADISTLEIDPSQRMADINREDNKMEIK